MRAIELIAEERERQKSVEGWTSKHDDEHGDGSLASAAACYAAPPHGRTRWWSTSKIAIARELGIQIPTPSEWPDSWHESWWKPTPEDRERELVKAGALIIAEIERIWRAAERERASTPGGSGGERGE